MRVTARQGSVFGTTQHVRTNLSINAIERLNLHKVVFCGEYSATLFGSSVCFFLSTIEWISYTNKWVRFLFRKISIYIELHWTAWGKMTYYLMSLRTRKRSCCLLIRFITGQEVCPDVTSRLRGGVSMVCRHTNPGVMLTSHRCVKAAVPDSTAEMSVVWVGRRLIDFCVGEIIAH